MHVSKNSMWRRMWKILQNFQRTKQGLWSAHVRVVRWGTRVYSKTQMQHSVFCFILNEILLSISLHACMQHAHLTRFYFRQGLLCTTSPANRDDRSRSSRDGPIRYSEVRSSLVYHGPWASSRKADEAAMMSVPFRSGHLESSPK